MVYNVCHSFAFFFIIFICDLFAFIRVEVLKI